MGYTSVVCVKQVPDTKRITGNAMREDGTVNRAALPAIFNPEDRNALEAALRVRDEHGGTVTVVTMGLPSACDVLREALERGADRCILITDRRAAASDTLATSYILSCAVGKLKPDLVFCGRQAIDGDTAQVGPQLAEKLGFTLMTYMEELALEGREARVTRNIGNGRETALARLPALFTVMESANEMRPAAMRKIMKFKKARAPMEIANSVKTALGVSATPEALAAETSRRTEELAARGLLIDQWNLDDIGARLEWCGGAGSPTRVNRVQSVVLAGGDYREFEPTQASIGQLVAELVQDHTIG
ncbi:MAG: electron transfer flavoprotein subunit beta/FixA family protein [Lentisphaerae bacterium]|nr:electron transfer flavoprotein subunit beta/FixA family protein [Lentisphaerota bacterium]